MGPTGHVHHRVCGCRIRRHSARSRTFDPLRDTDRHGLCTAQVEHLRTLRNQDSGHQDRLGNSLHHNLEGTPLQGIRTMPTRHVACITEDIAQDAGGLHQDLHPTDDVEDDHPLSKGLLRVFTAREPGLDCLHDTGSPCHACNRGTDNHVIHHPVHDIDQCVIVFVFVLIIHVILDHD